MWPDDKSSKASCFLLSILVALFAWTAQTNAAPPSSSSSASSVLLVKGYEAYELLLKTDSEAPLLRESCSVRLGRIVVALAEFAGNGEPVQLFLKKIESDKGCEKIKLPGWLVFPDEYQDALQRITRAAPKDVQTSELALYESDPDLEWGLEKRYTLSLLAHESIERLAKKK